MIAGIVYGLMVGMFIGCWVAYFTRGWWNAPPKLDDMERVATDVSRVIGRRVAMPKPSDVPHVTPSGIRTRKIT